MSTKCRGLSRFSRFKGMVGYFAALIVVLPQGLVLGQQGPSLPAQPPQTINELTALIVTNTAVETNLASGRQFTGVYTTNRQTFAYANRNALLADGWSFLATTSGTNRNTEITNRVDGWLVDYDQSLHPGSINIPCDQGDLWGTGPDSNNTRNFLSRSLPPNWTRANLAIRFTPVPSVNFQQTHLVLYQDDDNFIQVGVAHNDITVASDGSTNMVGGVIETLVWEYNGYPGHYVVAAALSDWLELRFDRDPHSGMVSGWWSKDGVNFAELGTPTVPPLVNPRLAIWAGGSPANIAGVTTLVVRALEVDTFNPAVAFSYRLLNPPAGASIDANGVITWTPAEGQGPSTNVFTTVVTDNGIPPLSATNSFTVMVADVNVAPVLPPQPDRMISVLNPLLVTNRATDTDIPANPLTYHLTVAPPGATISSDGVISWTPTPDQQLTTNLFVTVVTDFNAQAVNAQSLSATNSFTVIVLPPPWPVLPNRAGYTVDELTTLVVTNAATDGSLTVSQIVTNSLLLTYSSRSALLADGWTFIGTDNLNNPRNTEITTGAGVVDYNQATHPGVLRFPCNPGDLWNRGGSTANTLFRALPADWLSVRLFLNFPAVAANYQQAHLGLYQNDDNYLQMGVAFNSANGEGFTMDSEVGGNPTALAKVATGSTNLYFRLDRNPTNSAITGYYSVDGVIWTALAASTRTLSNPRLMVWTGGAQTPFVSGMPTMDLRRLDIIAPASVPTVLSYALVDAPPGASIDNNGLITWQPSETNGPGAAVFTTVVTDNGLSPLRATNTFTVTVNEVNQAPTLLVQPDRVLTGLESLSVSNSAMDPDLPSNSLTFSLARAPAGATIDAQGVISWTPSPEQVPSTNVFATVVTDDNPWAVNARHLSATNSFTVVVNAIHNGPALPALANLTIPELSLLTVTNAATSADLPGLPLVYSLINPPAGMAIDSNGTITWKPGEAQGPSTNFITTAVTDTGHPALSATNTFVAIVQEVNTAPVLPFQPDRTVSSTAPLVITNTATDADIPVNALTYHLTQAPAGATIDSHGVITWTPEPVSSTNQFTTVVTDQNPWDINFPQLSATNSFTVTVLPSAQAPTISVLPLGNGRLGISWDSVAGATYRVQYKDRLDQTNWSDLPLDIIASGPTTTVSEGIGATAARYYRVQKLP